MSDHAGDSQAERKAVYAKRKDFSAAFGAFVRTMRAALAEYLGMRAQGVDREDAIRGLESVIREAWPKPSTKYPPQCDACDDLGYEERVCRQFAWCERARCREKGTDWQHLYVVVCTCPAGDKFRRRAHQQESVSIGKVKPKRGFSRMGT